MEDGRSVGGRGEGVAGGGNARGRAATGSSGAPSGVSLKLGDTLTGKLAQIHPVLRDRPVLCRESFSEVASITWPAVVEVVGTRDQGGLRFGVE